MSTSQTLKLCSSTFTNQLCVSVFRYQTKATLLDAVRNLPYQGGNTNTAGGLEVMREQLFSSADDRNDVQNVAIVITDGK